MKPTLRAGMRVLCIGLALGGVLALALRTAHAAPHTVRLVTKAADTNDAVCDADCSLREAIAAADSSDTITFAGDYAIVLSLGSLEISKNLTIDATGHTVSISGNDTVRVLHITGSPVTLTHLTITHGFANGDNGGGILIPDNVQFTLNDSTLSLNRATYDGGAIRTNNATTVINRTTFLKNKAGTFGGAVALIGGSADIYNSTFNRNRANTGASLYADTGSTLLTVANSTFYKEKSDKGALYFRTDSKLYNNTIYKAYRRTAGVGLVLVGGTHELRNNIIAGNLSRACYRSGAATVSVNVNTLADDRSCKQNATGYRVANPMLGAFGNHGGATDTLTLLNGSPAVDTGDDATCAAAPVNGLDQRGIVRPQGAHCDRGAYELTPTP